MNFLSTIFAQQDTTVNIQPEGFDVITGADLGSWISWFVTIILIIAGLLFFFMLVIGGIRWITSGGDKGSTESARNQITAALIGLIIVFAAWAIVSLLGNAFGIEIFNFTIPGLGSGGGGGTIS